MSLRKRGAVEEEEVRERGMVVAVKDTFGFLRPPAVSLQAAKKLEDVFFHFDSLSSKPNVHVGDEFSYVIQNKSNSKRSSAVNLVRLAPNEMFRTFSSKQQLTERVGQVVSVDTNGTVFVECMHKGTLERLPCVSADFPTAKVGDYYLFKLCVHPLERNLVAIGPTTLFSSSPVAARILPQNKVQLGDGDVVLPYVTVLSSALQVGDGIWVQTNAEQTMAVVTSVFLPHGEEEDTLLAWLDSNKEGEKEEEEARQSGVVVTVKDGQFAFATMTAAATGNKDQVYINWNELCALPPALHAGAAGGPSLQVGDVVSFQLRKRKEGSNGVAIRVFNQTRFGNKRNKNQRIVFQPDNHGVLQFKGNRAFVDFSQQVKQENLAMWQRLDCEGLVPVEGDAKRYKEGQQVTFDLVVMRKSKSDKLHCVATLQRPKLRAAAASEQVGFVSHAGSICSASRPQHKITFNSKEYANIKPGDFVQFNINNSTGGEDLQASAVHVLSSASTDMLGLVPLQPQTRIRGVCTKFAAGSGTMDASWVRASYTNGPGRILVGGSTQYQFDEAEASKKQEEDPADWRKLAELQRSVKTLCATSHHAFTLFSTAEVAAVEKECKRLGLLSAKHGAGMMIACGKDKAVLDLWAKRLGKTVRIASGVLGRIVECQFTPEDRMVLELELEDGCHAALLADESSELQFVDAASTSNARGEDNMQAALRDWVTYVKPLALPNGATYVDDENTLQLPISAKQACLDECLYFTEKQDGTLLVSRNTHPRDAPPGMAQYGFSSTNDVFPIEGDEVDFIPCVSATTGRLRAWDVRILTRQTAQRTEGVVEELRSGGGGGGWIRPTGLTSVKFEGTDVLSKPLTLGDHVDFYLNKDRAHRVRFLKHGELPHSVAGISLTVPSSVSNTPSRFSHKSSSSNNNEQDENLNKIAMPANYLTAPGPDEDYAVGFTPEKWRFKRQVKIRATAAEFIPQSFTSSQQQQ